MPLSRGSAVARRRSHKAGSTWSGLLASFVRVQWLNASHQGIPLDCLNPTLDIPCEFSRRASIFDHSLGIPGSSARDRLSNPFGGSARDLSRLSWVRTLAYRGRKRTTAVCLSARWARLFRQEPLRHCTGTEIVASRLCGEKKTVRRRIYGGSYHVYWICPLVGCRL